MKRKLFLIIFITLTFFLCGLLCFQKTKQEQTKKLENENVLFSLFQGDEKVDTIPSKDSGYYFDRDKSNCTNDAQIEWDSVNWSPAVSVKEENQERVSCNLYFTTNYREGILNGTDPVLKDEMIPITLENDGTVKKADLTKPWYSYADKKWANAVLLQNSYDALDAEGKVNSVTKQDGYVSFDGVDDYINLGLANYDFGNQVTIALKFVLKSKKTSSQEIFANVESAGISFWTINDTLVFEIYNENESKYINLYYQGINLNETYTVVGKYDGKKIFFYVNGKLASESDGEFNIKTSPVPFLLGANPNIKNGELTMGTYSNVDVYQAAIYNRVLSDEEIKNNMTNEIKVTDNTGLLKYVDFTNRQNYEANEVIPEDVIESYFVWIPKYRYKLWDLGNYDGLTSIDTSKVHTIDILFGDYNTDDSMGKECTTPMTSGATGNCKVGDYMTHPAFISIPSTGFWVGKFETGYKGATTTSSAQSNTYDTSKIEIKPNVYSWRSIQASNAHLNSYSYKRNLDSHMMKNTEWGAVSYLQRSKYGSQKEVRINNNSNYVTGYAANNEPTCGYTGKNESCNIQCSDNSCNSSYNTTIGYLAATTENIYGIYDMNGGSYDITMTVVYSKDKTNYITGVNNIANSGFNGLLGCPTCWVNVDETITEVTDGINLPDKKYFDIYDYVESYSNYSKRILGDATGELGPFSTNGIMSANNQTRQISSWNSSSYNAYYADQFFARGFSFQWGTDAGLLTYGATHGESLATASYRIILTPTKGNAL